MTQQPDPNAGLRTAGTIAIWVWILIAAVPVLLIGGCLVMCAMGSIVSGVDQSVH